MNVESNTPLGEKVVTIIEDTLIQSVREELKSTSKITQKYVRGYYNSENRIAQAREKANLMASLGMTSAPWNEWEQDVMGYNTDDFSRFGRRGVAYGNAFDLSCASVCP
jgi:poly-gamma-glutamate capsule biosynthesis protein CapA/YwtB (metallophosphatase superfamily)